MKAFWQKGALALLGLAAIVSTIQGFVNAMQLSQDFQWSPARLFVEGKNPYEVWLSGNIAGDIILSQAPNYLHLAYLALFPLGVMDFSIAKPVWALVNIALAITLTVILSYHWRLSRTSIYLLVCLFLCSTPFRNGLGNGQHALFVMAFLILPVVGVRGGHVLQGLGYVKYSFAPPFFLYNIFYHGAARAALGLLFPLLGLAGFCMWTSTSPASALIQPLQVASGAVGLGSADAMSVIEVLFGVGTAVSGLLALTLSVGLSFLVARHAETERHLPLIALVALVTFKHLPYDFVFLMPLLAFSLRSDAQVLRMPLWAGIAWFWFGQKIMGVIAGRIGYDLNRIQEPLLLVNFAILLGMIALLLLNRPVAPTGQPAIHPAG